MPQQSARVQVCAQAKPAPLDKSNRSAMRDSPRPEKSSMSDKPHPIQAQNQAPADHTPPNATDKSNARSKLKSDKSGLRDKLRSARDVYYLVRETKAKLKEQQLAEQLKRDAATQPRSVQQILGDGHQAAARAEGTARLHATREEPKPEQRLNKSSRPNALPSGSVSPHAASGTRSSQRLSAIVENDQEHNYHATDTQIMTAERQVFAAKGQASDLAAVTRAAQEAKIRRKPLPKPPGDAGNDEITRMITNRVREYERKANGQITDTPSPASPSGGCTQAFPTPANNPRYPTFEPEARLPTSLSPSALPPRISDVWDYDRTLGRCVSKATLTDRPPKVVPQPWNSDGPLLGKVSRPDPTAMPKRLRDNPSGLVPHYAFEHSKHRWRDCPTFGKEPESYRMPSPAPSVKSEFKLDLPLPIRPKKSAPPSARFHKRTVSDGIHDYRHVRPAFSFESDPQSDFIANRYDRPSISSVLVREDVLRSKSHRGDDLVRNNVTRREQGGPAEARRGSQNVRPMLLSRGSEGSTVSFHTASEGHTSSTNARLATQGRTVLREPPGHSLAKLRTTSLPLMTPSPAAPRMYAWSEAVPQGPSIRLQTRLRNGSIGDQDYGMISGGYNGVISSLVVDTDHQPVLTQHAESTSRRSSWGHDGRASHHAYSNESDGSPCSVPSKNDSPLETNTPESVDGGISLKSRYRKPFKGAGSSHASEASHAYGCSYRGCRTASDQRTSNNFDPEVRLQMMEATCQRFESMMFDLPSDIAQTLYECVGRRRALADEMERLHHRAASLNAHAYNGPAQAAWKHSFHALCDKVAELDSAIRQAQVSLHISSDGPEVAIARTEGITRVGRPPKLVRSTYRMPKPVPAKAKDIEAEPQQDMDKRSVTSKRSFWRRRPKKPLWVHF